VDAWLEDGRTAALLARLEPEITSWAVGGHPRVNEIALQLIERGGKRLRPALLFLAAPPGAPDQALLAAAASLELLHVASLYHDDVMDRADTRRGGASANAAFGNPAAAAGGIYLVARAAGVLASLPVRIGALVADSTARICAGQLREAENRFNTRLSEAEHLEILALKTGTLVELPCRLGAELGGAAPEVIEALATYGREVGLAFQLADDALDLAGHPSRLGKPVASDLREGVYSLATLRVLAREGPGGPLGLLVARANLTPPEIEAALERIRASGAVAEALDLARTHSERAIAALEPLPPSPARRSLANLARYAVERDR
jgi:geranylgeranyl pyrophosphate synthase